mgnify:FL=1
MRVLAGIILLCLLVSSQISQANSTLEVLEISHAKFSEPLKFNITLPAGYANNPDKSYIMMFDFHHNANSYLDGMHEWMSHNGEFRATIIYRR